MQIVLKTLVIISLITNSSCNNLERKLNKSSDEETLLIASQKFSNVGNTDRIFKIFKDSSYNFTETIVEPNYNKIESFKGKVQIKNDTIIFFPFRFNHNNSEIAVLKNGFIEFIDSKYPVRMKIEDTSLFIKNNIDFRKFQDYAVFTFYKSFEISLDEQNYKNHDLTTGELAKIETILKQIFKNKPLLNYSHYIKQIESVRNEKGQNLIFVRCYCKSFHTNESYQYRQIEMHDGGNCNIYIALNLTTERIEALNIAGDA